MVVPFVVVHYLRLDDDFTEKSMYTIYSFSFFFFKKKCVRFLVCITSDSLFLLPSQSCGYVPADSIFSLLFISFTLGMSCMYYHTPTHACPQVHIISLDNFGHKWRSIDYII
jgi:hypothetical protein